LALAAACALPTPFVTPAFAANSASQAASTASPIVRPPELERDVQFWIRVYTQVSTSEGLLHDERNLGVIYSSVTFDPGVSPSERREGIDKLRDRYRAILKRLAAGATDLSAEEEKVRLMFGVEASPARYTQAMDEIRFQLGQSDRFKAGLIRSGAWESHIADSLANLGLPPEISALPHVESSFDPTAYSKVGASGLWQFMRSTGRRFLRIDDAVDERMDPFRSSEAAAQLLDFNYRLLGSWPLAITAYNHGAAGMARAKDAMGTSDIVRIVRNHRSKSFGFASRNFYVCFLAALEIDRNPEKYFGPIERRPEMRFAEVAMPAFVPVTAVEKLLKLKRSELESLNPALRSPVWVGQRHIPKGYRLRLPPEAGQWTTEMLASRLAPTDLYAGQPRPRSIRVGKGDTLASLARANNVDLADLARVNNLKTTAKVKTGRSLILPVETRPALASATPPPAPKADEAATGATLYIVKQGDSLTDIAGRTRVPVATLVALNQLRNPDSLYEGQRLRLTPAEEAPPDVLVAAVTANPRTEAVATEALLSDRREETQVAEAAEQPRAEPVSAAQAEAQGPALVPGNGVAQASDPVDYSVHDDGTIRIAAAETIGHYADWLGVTASSLRALNGIRASRPVVMGKPFKLDFGKVSRAGFEQKRRDYHQQLQAAFFANHRIAGTEVYVSRKGDSLWAITQRYDRLPVWLLQQYNTDLDFSDLRAGTRMVVPKVEELTGL
jgi:membrane-bound lytic murein transglycosylase D